MGSQVVVVMDSIHGSFGRHLVHGFDGNGLRQLPIIGPVLSFDVAFNLRLIFLGEAAEVVATSD